MSKNKVFCKNCKWFDRERFNYDYCNFPGTIVKRLHSDTYYHPGKQIPADIVKPLAELKNRRNNCKDFTLANLLVRIWRA